MADKKSNIVLIGMPGAGKSTLGVVLAKIMGKNFMDCDILIQNEMGKTLQVLIDENGPEGFIDIENRILSEIEAENCIISTGGSAIYSHEAMMHLTEIGTVVYLKVSLEELTGRLGGLVERGVVMKNGNNTTLAELMDERVPLYEKYAEVTLQTEGTSIREGALMLAAKIAAL